MFVVAPKLMLVFWAHYPIVVNFCMQSFANETEWPHVRQLGVTTTIPTLLWALPTSWIIYIVGSCFGNTYDMQKSWEMEWGFLYLFSHDHSCTIQIRSLPNIKWCLYCEHIIQHLCDMCLLGICIPLFLVFTIEKTFSHWIKIHFQLHLGGSKLW